MVAVIARQLLAQVGGGPGLAHANNGLQADRFVDRVRSERHHRTQGRRIGGRVVQRDRSAVAVADQHAILDRERREQLGQHLVGLDLHVFDAGIGGPRARLAIGGAVVDHAVALQDVAKLLREVAPHLDAAQPLVQEDERRALEAVAFLRAQAAYPQGAVAEVDELIAHTSALTGTGRREKAPIAAGSTVRNRQGASSMPPTTTIASGRCTWLPIAVEKAAGSRPTQAATQVIRTGRICCRQVARSAGSRSRPASMKRLKAPTTMMPFIAAMPNRATKPIAAEMLNGMSASVRLMMPPISAIGIALPASSVSVRLPKLT